MKEFRNHSILLSRMDEAFCDYSQQAEKLSVLLGGPRDPSSWSLYHELLKQQTAEVVAYENYRLIKDEVFRLISPPEMQKRPESTVG